MTPRRALSYCLATLAFALPLSIAGANIALAALSLAVIWHFAQDRRAASSALNTTVRSPVFLALVAYTLWSLIASLAGLNPEASLRLWPKDIHKLWAFLAIGTAILAADNVPVTAPLAAGLGLHAAVGVGQAVKEWIGGAEAIRAHGFLHPVTYAEMMGIGLLGAAAYLARSASSNHRPRPAAVLFALLAAAVVTSQTRAVLIALASAYGVACVLEPRWRRHIVSALLILCGVVAFWEIMPTGGPYGRSLRNLISSDATRSSHHSRFKLWDVALRVARDYPLSGVGPGRYRETFERYHPQKIGGEATWGNAHNIYLHHLAERGVPGLIFLLSAIAALIISAWRTERTNRDAWSLWAATATGAFFVMNLTEVAWQTEQVFTFFIFAWLLGAGPRPAREIL